MRQTRSLSVFFIRCTDQDQMGFMLPQHILNFHLICHPVQHLGLFWHQCGPYFFGPINICFLNYLSPDVVSIQPNLTLFYYFLPLISNLFGDTVICWVLTMLPNLEASVICINKGIFLFNLLIKAPRNNISVLHIQKHWYFSQTVSFTKSQPISKPHSSPVQFYFGAKQNIQTLVLW